jgi:predicted RNA-binding Zn-ribbon protein involved in translation (DUF1610 family)
LKRIFIFVTSPGKMLCYIQEQSREINLAVPEETMFQAERNPAEQPDSLNPRQRQVLGQAKHLVSQGKPGQAAPLFAELAEVEGANHPQHAANLHAQAAHAFADEQRGPAALIQARAALKLFLKYQMDKRTSMFYADITRKLNDKGMKNTADALISEFGSRIAALPAGATSATQKHGMLPTNCPQCGAPIQVDKAGWVDSNTVECSYCGSQIRPV